MARDSGTFRGKRYTRGGRAQVRQALFDIYEPQRGSPLIEAGRRIDGEAATRPSIGAGR